MSRHTGYEVARRVLSVQTILEWAFRTERVQLDLPEQFEAILGRGYGRGTWGGMAEQEALGCRVDGGGRSDCHEDAEVVAAIVSNLTDLCGGKMMAIKVAEFARAGTTPDWMPGAVPQIIPSDVKGDGKPREVTFGYYREVTKVWVDRRGRQRTKYKDRPMYGCSVTEKPSRHKIDRARNAYTEWWLALSEIRRCLQCSNALRRHEVSNAMPPEAPWRKEPMPPMIEGLTANGWR